MEDEISDVKVVGVLPLPGEFGGGHCALRMAFIMTTGRTVANSSKATMEIRIFL